MDRRPCTRHSTVSGNRCNVTYGRILQQLQFYSYTNSNILDTFVPNITRQTCNVTLTRVHETNVTVESSKYYMFLFPGGKDGRRVGLTTLPASCADCLEILDPQPLGTPRACPGLYIFLCVTTYKMRILIFSTTFSSNTSHYEKNSARYCHKGEKVFMQSARCSCQP
jgi:hypothetical protein